MTSPRSLLPALLLGLALLAPAAIAAETETVAVAGEMKTVDLTVRRRAVGPTMHDLVLSAEKPEGATAAPEDAFGARYGLWTFKGDVITIVLAKSAETVTGFDRLLIDRNADGAFGEGETKDMAVQTRPMRDGSSLTTGMVRDLTISSGEQDWTFLVGWMKRGEQAVTAQVVGLWYLEGKVAVGDSELLVELRDVDVDGSFGGEKDTWILRANAEDMSPAREFNWSTHTEKRFRDGRLFSMKSVDGFTAKIAHEPADGPDPASMTSQRERVEHLWAERFDAERETFIVQRKLDTSRPLAEKPIAWRYVTFDQAKEMSKAEGKPLFVDVMAFWCVWCYRMDYYTYPDAEVAEILNTKFIPDISFA